jgi:hypothetical protein
VSCGLISVDWQTSVDFVHCPPGFWNVTSCEASLWLVTMTTIGPAPKCAGDTETLLGPTNAVTLIGAAGRGLFL